MTIRTNRCVAPIALLVIASTCLGCQQQPVPDGMPELHPVSITILQKGKPLQTASIRLIPEDGTSQWSSGGSTDENGVAVIRTHGKYAGAPAGSYKVTVTKIEMPEPASPDLGPLKAASSAGGATYDLVAPEYSYPNQTPLRLEVGAGDNQQEFDLGEPVRIERKGPPSP